MTFEEQLNNNSTVPDFPTFSPEPLPDWLSDDNLLRDEAALLGLSHAPLEEKTSLIRLYFKQQTIQLEREREELGEKIGELNLGIEHMTNRIEELRQKITRLEAAKPDGEPHFLKTVTGLIACLGLLIGTYFLILETLKLHFGENRLISLGVALAGFLGLYHRTTMATAPTTPFSVRQLLTDAGLPFATSFFVFIYAYQTQSALSALGIFLFLFFLFLSVGKLIPGLLTALQNDFRYRNQEKNLKNEQKPKTVAWENEINLLTIRVDAIRVQKWQLLTPLNRVESELSHTNTRRDLLIQLFENEFNLARSLRDRLSEHQIRAIVASE
ncbi:hypothetical protein [Larkinella humicola]|uniref:Uncharacterized protein n=1 Tax=Larkinella humicola TaxID=2607654 RepID=A0A5N1J9N4_9BACT|nr:hypothetical protein [Larkinella humicola]KAA9349171.1 hypothetical protein F0P93_22490 [Larkinella humicola]